jgi:hypothetical protein
MDASPRLRELSAARAVIMRLRQSLPAGARDRFGRLPLSTVAAHLRVRVDVAPGAGCGSEGAVFAVDDTVESQLALFGRPEHIAYVHSEGVKARFTLAHELAHVLLAGDSFHSASHGVAVTERLVDAVAAELLVPGDAVIRALAELQACPPLSIAEVVRLSTLLCSSIRSLLIALERLALEGRIGSTCAMVVTHDVSARRREAPGPRIGARCMPPELWIPLNKRLSSLHARRIADEFTYAPLFRDFSITDTLAVWYRSAKEYRVHQWDFTCRMVKTVTEERMMLVTFVRSDMEPPR